MIVFAVYCISLDFWHDSSWMHSSWIWHTQPLQCPKYWLHQHLLSNARNKVGCGELFASTIKGQSSLTMLVSASSNSFLRWANQKETQDSQEGVMMIFVSRASFIVIADWIFSVSWNHIFWVIKSQFKAHMQDFGFCPNTVYILLCVVSSTFYLGHSPSLQDCLGSWWGLCQHVLIGLFSMQIMPPKIVKQEATLDQDRSLYHGAELLRVLASAYFQPSPISGQGLNLGHSTWKVCTLPVSSGPPSSGTCFCLQISSSRGVQHLSYSELHMGGGESHLKLPASTVNKKSFEIDIN